MPSRGAVGGSGGLRVMDALTRDADADEVPLFAGGDAGQTLVWRGPTPIARSALLHEAYAFAESMPASAEIAICCEDRYNFLVVFVACLLRGRPAILPHDPRQSALLAIAEQFPGALFAADRPIEAPRSLVKRVSFGGLRPPRVRSIPKIPGGRKAAILFTSGSTGRPMAVSRSWDWLVAVSRDYIAGLSPERLKGVTIVATVPPQHSFGLEATVMLPLRSGVSTGASRPLFPRDVVGALAVARLPTALITTPFHLEALLRSEMRYPEIALVLCATSPLSKTLAERAEAAFGAEVLEVYGCSEVGLVGTRRPTQTDLWTPGASLALRQARGCTFVSARHLPDQVELPDAIAPMPDGTFRLGERSSDMVKIAGHRASLSGLNATLRSIPGVVDGAIVCRPGETGARLVGFVVLEGRSLADVKRELRAMLAGPFMPRPLFEISALPRSATGKVAFEPLLSLLESKAGRT